MTEKNIVLARFHGTLYLIRLLNYVYLFIIQRRMYGLERNCIEEPEIYLVFVVAVIVISFIK